VNNIEGTVDCGGLENGGSFSEAHCGCNRPTETENGELENLKTETKRTQSKME